MRLFAFLTADPGLRTRTQAELRASKGFDQVSAPDGSSWLVARCASARADASFLEGEGVLASAPFEELARRCRNAQLDALPGDFTFACFPGCDEAFFVRSAAGTAPLFWWEGRAGVAVSSRLGDLLRYIPDEPPLDRLANAVLSGFASTPPEGRTPFERVRLLENGCVLQFSGSGRHTIRRWWHPRISEHPKPGSIGERAERLLEILVSALRAGTDTNGASLLTVSGGLDSTLLALLTSTTVRRRFSTLTLVPSLESDRALMRAQTKPLFDTLGGAVTHRWEFEHSAKARMTYLEDMRPEVAYVGHPALCLLERLQRERPIRAYVGGEFCDQILGGSTVALDYLFCASLTELLTQQPYYFAGPRGAARWLKARARRLLGGVAVPSASQPPPDFLSKDAQHEYLQAVRDEQAALACDHRPRAALAHQVRIAQPTLAQNWEVASRLGVRRVFPFFNRACIELAFETHPFDLASGREKSLVRHAAGLVLPGADRSKFAWRDPESYLEWGRRIPDELAGIVRSDWIDRPPARLPALVALRLQVALNMISAVRTTRAARRESGI